MATKGRATARTLAQIMADYTFSLRYDSIRRDLMTAARRHLADSLAYALGAYDTAAARAVRSHAIGKGGRADATILGTDRKVPVGMALVNGTMVRYLDANDIFVFSRGGPSGQFSDATPGLLALAEQYRCSGEELLTCLQSEKGDIVLFGCSVEFKGESFHVTHSMTAQELDRSS